MLATRVGIRALGHPLSLAAIGLLLLNDHALKAAAPSWLTGKLSDFAGLFFFPFLLAVVAAAPLEAMGRLGVGGGSEPQANGRRWAGRAAGLAFGLTLVWFVAIKTAPDANAWTATLAGWFAGGPVVIVRDPTDLAALVMLWPAWRLWVRLERAERGRDGRRTTGEARRAVPGWKGSAVLALAAVATIATAPCAPPLKVMRVTEVDGSLYAGLEWEHSADMGYAQSDADGSDWSSVEEAPDVVEMRFREAIAYPAVACDPENAQLCYRVSAAEQVEASSDGGQSWEVVWTIPPGRRSFMEHWLRQPLSCGAETSMEMGPYDLAFVRQPAGTALVVAMGGQGVLVRMPTGQWERRPVLSASPVPYLDSSPFVILPELVWSLVAGMLGLLGLTALAWSKVLANAPEGWDKVLGRAWISVAGVAVFALAVLGAGSLGMGALGGMGLGLALLVTGLFMGWGQAANVATKADNVWGMAAASVVAAFVTGLAPIALFSAWAAGSIAFYEAALAASAGLGGAALASAVAAIVRLARKEGRDRAE